MKLIETNTPIPQKPTFIMAVDTYDKNAMAYCLAKHTDGTAEIIIAKTMTKQEEFDQEVANLCKYFDAKMIKEK